MKSETDAPSGMSLPSIPILKAHVAKTCVWSMGPPLVSTRTMSKFANVTMSEKRTVIEMMNHWWVLIIVYPTLTVPFCTWIMIGYFASIPKELDEAALIDGAGYIQILTRVFIPVALPGIIAATIFCFTVSWANFLYPLAFTTSADQLVLPVGIVTTLIKGDVYNWGQIMTGALLGAAPPLIIYAFLMDYYIAGLTAGATKG